MEIHPLFAAVLAPFRQGVVNELFNTAAQEVATKTLAVGVLDGKKPVYVDDLAPSNEENDAGEKH